jgi:hypothetical protein
MQTLGVDGEGDSPRLNAQERASRTEHKRKAPRLDAGGPLIFQT